MLQHPKLSQDSQIRKIKITITPSKIITDTTASYLSHFLEAKQLYTELLVKQNKILHMIPRNTTYR